MQPNASPDEVRLFRRWANDLVSILALPATWAGQGSSRVASALIEGLLRLLRLDFAYMRVVAAVEGSETEWARQSEDCREDVGAADIGRALERQLMGDSAEAGGLIPNPVGEGMTSVALFRLGIRDPLGVLVAGSRREAFPTDFERLILHVAVNQAAIGLEEARHVGQERRVTQALEWRVAERTAELAAATEAARQEALERTRAQERVLQDERELRFLVDRVPQMIWVMTPDGTLLRINRTALDYLGRTSDELITFEARVTAIYHPDDVRAVRAAIEGVRSSGLGRDLEARMRRQDGQYRRFHLRCEPLLDDQGRVLRLYLSATDVEGWKQAEERMQEENVALREKINEISVFEEIVGSSPPLKSVLAYITRVAPTDSTVLVSGETGTGKELVARAIHKRSRRSSRSFVSVNCAAIPAPLVASELFGHEKGAFTGALQRRIGKFELAEGGTIFLDEVGELSLETQVALLRVLQEREFERVGGSRPIRTDVRIVAATNRNIQEAVATGVFRADLFYRLNVVPVVMPSLRDRREDIPLLVEYFVDRYSRNSGKSVKRVSRKSLEMLQSYSWPGNIRELQNVIERSVIVAETDTLTVDERWLLSQSATTLPAHEPFAAQLTAREKAMIEAALTETQGRVSGPAGAATKLQMASSTLESKIRSLGIDKRRFRSVYAAHR